MRKNFFKKLVLTLAVVAAATSANILAEAKAVPGFKSEKVSLEVGQTKRYSTKNIKGYSVKFKIGQRKVATVNFKKEAGVVKVTGVTPGKTTLRADFKNNKTKKTITAKIPVTVKTRITVSTQEGLEKALKIKGLKKLVLKTKEELAFTIPAGEYKNIELVVDAKNADVENNGTFEAVTIKNIKPSTWKEKAKGNNIVITAKNARVIVEEGASVGYISLDSHEAQVSLEVNGAVEQVDVKTKATVDISGTVQNLEVKVEKEAVGSELKSSVKVALDTVAEIKVALEKGAEGSQITVSDEKVSVTVENKSNAAVHIETSTGSQKVESGESVTGGQSNTTGNTGSTGGTGGSGGGGTVTTRYELSGYADNLEITPTEEMKDKLEVNSWTIRFKETVAADASVTVNGNKIVVAGKEVAALSTSVNITGLDKNSNKVTGTAGVQWRVAELSNEEGVYDIMGDLQMPYGWTNPQNRSIRLTFIVTAQIAEDIYGIEYADLERGFVLTPEADDSLIVTAIDGSVVISSEQELDGSLLKLAENKLYYEEKVIGTLPAKVWVTGRNLKDETKESSIEIGVTWEWIEYNNVPGSYMAIAKLTETEKWINLRGMAAVMQINLVSNTRNVKDIVIWNEADAMKYASQIENVSQSAITAAIAGSSVQTTTETTVDELGRLTVTYTLTGTIAEVPLKTDEEAAPYLLFTIEKAVDGIWLAADNEGNLRQADQGYAFDGLKLIGCRNYRTEQGKFFFVLDVDGDGKYTQGDVKYIVDASGLNQ